MKAKVNYKELKSSLTKALKGVQPSKTNGFGKLLKISAKDDRLTVSVNGFFGIEVNIPAAVEEEGYVVTDDREIMNIMFLPARENVMIEKRKGSNIATVRWGDTTDVVRMRMPELDFLEVRKFNENSEQLKSCIIPAAMFKSMCKNVLWASDDGGMNAPSLTNVVKIVIKPVDGGIGSITMTTTDSFCVMRREEKIKSQGKYEGEIQMSASQLNKIVQCLDEENDIHMYIDDGNLYFVQKDIFVDAKKILTGVASNTPEKLYKGRRSKFFVSFSRNALLEGLVAIKSWVIDTQKDKMVASFEKDRIVLEVWHSQEKVGSLSVPAFLSASEGFDFDGFKIGLNKRLLDNIIAEYPDETVVMDGFANKYPVWFCAGTNNEYAYMLLPVSLE